LDRPKNRPSRASRFAPEDNRWPLDVAVAPIAPIRQLLRPAADVRWCRLCASSLPFHARRHPIGGFPTGMMVDKMGVRE
jgi:hypothetical protein